VIDKVTGGMIAARAISIRWARPSVDGLVIHDMDGVPSPPLDRVNPRGPSCLASP
jgi:hypothetical protein